MSNSLLSSPILTGTLTESSLYQIMSVGLTDTILLMGHADATIMYEPYQVIDAKKAIAFLNKDPQSPLLRAFLEAYNAGCKDIRLMAVAPMSEYQSTISDRLISNPGFGNKTFYQIYFERLTTAYASLYGYDFPEIVVPVEAVFYNAGSVDFLNQLIDFCESTFSVTGSVCLGVLGTRVSNFSSTDIDAMVNDSRLASIGAAGKFVMVVVGEGTVSHPQMSSTYATSLSTTIASLIAVSNRSDFQEAPRSVAGLPLPNVASVVGNDLQKEDLERLAQARLNVVARTTRGKRGYAFQTRLLTDNTLGQENSDFWSMGQMHIVATVINQIRAFGFSYIGTIYLAKFKQTVYDYLTNLTARKYIKDFSLNIVEEDHGQRALVYVGIVPIFGIRQITFQIEVGPGA